MPSRAPHAEDMTGLVHRPDSFVSGLAGSPDLKRVAEAIIAVVEASFESHPMRGGSNKNLPAWRERRDFVVKVFRELQGDLKWTTDRALSMMRPALLAHLEGLAFHVGRRQEGRAMWAPDQLLSSQGVIHVDDPANAPAGPSDGVESLDELKQKLKLKLGLDIDADAD